MLPTHIYISLWIYSSQYFKLEKKLLTALVIIQNTKRTNDITVFCSTLLYQILAEKS